jgi:hypothetical protein
MQADVDTIITGIPIEIRGVNAVGHESHNALICDGRTIPWLQDVAAVNAWGAWGARWRDVVVLDSSNVVIHVYNLDPPNNLGDPVKYAELKTLLLNAAQ